MSFAWDIIITNIISAGLGAFLGSFWTEKGKNLATKQDIKGITDKIESVKHDYAKQLEAMKADFSAKLKTHGFRYEKEFILLQELSAKLFAVSTRCLALRPRLDLVPKGKLQDEINEERLEAAYSAMRDFILLAESNKPFFSENIYKALQESQRLFHKEILSLQDYMEFGLRAHDNPEYWSSAEINQEAIEKAVESLQEAIRQRVIDWDKISEIP